MSIPRLILGLIVVLIVIGAAFIFAQMFVSGSLFGNDTATVTIHGEKLEVTVAKDDTTKQVGLSDKSSLEENKGMLFPFEEPGYYAFWMRDMKFPIDIIFLRGDRVVQIYRNIQPASGEDIPIYRPNEPADSVLEINAGLSDKYNLKEGDTINISGLDTQSSS
jgi:uncharacterized protein